MDTGAVAAVVVLAGILAGSWGLDILAARRNVVLIRAARMRRARLARAAL